MATLLILIFILACFWQLSGLLLKLSPLFWKLYLKLAPSQDVDKLRKQQAEVLRIRKEMATTSSQDEFAKWAKLRREHDKRVAELEKLSEGVASQRQKFNQIVSSCRWFVFSLAAAFIQLWYRKEPVFWLPRDLLPNYIEWGLAFPQAPRGSISVNVWSTCAAVVTGYASKWIEARTTRPIPVQPATGNAK
ncbi:hypothetical protein AA313_de0208927 [Arthrobotrys entomopaga]|nr:hypothetical protein AA313_de0208927 [Arthrobotrys entomopaga]